MTSLSNVRPVHHVSSAVLPANGQPVTLPEQIDDEARAYRDRGDAIGEFIANYLDRLSQLVRWTGAQNPEQHEDRMEVWDDEIRAKWFDRGYQAGVEATSGVYGLSLDDQD